MAGDSASPSPGVVLEVCHVVCTFNAGVTLHPRFLAIKLPNTRYTYGNPVAGGATDPEGASPRGSRTFHRVMYETRKPAAKFTIHPSGRVTIFAAKSVADAATAARKLVRTLHRFPCYTAARVDDFRVTNLVASTPRGALLPVRLGLLKTILDATRATHLGTPSFNAEIWQALKVEKEIDGCNVAVQVFSSGAVVVVGAKSLHVASQFFHTIHPYIVQAKHEHPNLESVQSRENWRNMCRT